MTTLISTISKTYAKALLDTGGDYKMLESQLNEISNVINSSKDLRVIMSNSSIAISKKIEIIDEIFGGKIDTKLLNLLKILIEKNRFNEFESVKEAVSKLTEEVSNKKTVEIISPVKLNFENRTNVLFKLEHKLNKEITPIWTVDKSLIAGLAFKIDDCVIDTSIRAKLENLSKNINRG